MFGESTTTAADPKAPGTRQVKHSDLGDFSQAIFRALGATAKNAKTVSEHLVEASLRGVDSHGVSRIPVYAEGVIAGDIDPAASPEVLRETTTTALLDARSSFGQVAGLQATLLAISKAKKSGTSVVGVRDLNHVGMLSIYGERIAREGLIGRLYTNGMARVAPWGSRQRIFGTNPLCFAFPTTGKDPITVDIATSVAAAFKVVIAAKEGRKIPEGWAVDESGRPTSDPNEALLGALLPIAGYKGYGLGLSVEVLSSVLTGAPHSADVKPIPYTQGGLLIEAMRVDLFRSRKEYYKDMDRVIQRIRQSKVAEGFKEVLLPGEPEMRERAKRLLGGIPVGGPLWKDFRKWSEKLSVPLPKVS